MYIYWLKSGLASYNMLRLSFPTRGSLDMPDVFFSIARRAYVLQPRVGAYSHYPGLVNATIPFNRNAVAPRRPTQPRCGWRKFRCYVYPR